MSKHTHKHNLFYILVFFLLLLFSFVDKLYRRRGHIGYFKSERKEQKEKQKKWKGCGSGDKIKLVVSHKDIMEHSNPHQTQGYKCNFTPHMYCL